MRIEALSEVLDAVRAIRCPDGKSVGWTSEFTEAIQAVCRVLENQIAQAEGRVTLRKRSRGNRPRPR